jgi:putative inorganic carbon (hco3(-)) transporter
LALPLAFAAAFAALERLRAEIRRTQRGWLLLAEREGSLLIWHLVLAGFLVAGLVASRSRGGAAAFLGAAALLLVTRRERGLLTVAVGIATLAAAVWAGTTLLAQGVGLDAVESSRLFLWRDFVRVAPHFPFFGAGFDAFDTAYLRYQTINRGEFWAEAHNEYLTVLIDTGLVGLALFVVAFVRTGRALAPALRRDPLAAGLVCSLLAGALHALVDYNWQIPANAATFAILLGVARAQVSIGEPIH